MNEWMNEWDVSSHRSVAENSGLLGSGCITRPVVPGISKDHHTQK
jgi:hypothetical protein